MSCGAIWQWQQQWQRMGLMESNGSVHTGGMFLAIAVTQCERAFIHVSYREVPAHIKELVWHPPP